MAKIRLQGISGNNLAETPPGQGPSGSGVERMRIVALLCAGNNHAPASCSARSLFYRGQQEFSNPLPSRCMRNRKGAEVSDGVCMMEGKGDLKSSKCDDAVIRFGDDYLPVSAGAEPFQPVGQRFCIYGIAELSE